MVPVTVQVLYVEPYDGGSHAMFTRVLTEQIAAQWTAVTLPGRHWKWRMRGSAVYAALERADALARPHDLVLASSYVPLAELCGLCPALAGIPSLLYFHENQLAYPASGARHERDHHFGVTQMVSALASTRCAFNSAYNRDTFLREADALLSRMPDAIPRGWVPRIRERSVVLPVPLDLEDVAPACCAADHTRGPLLLYNQRWEHDKNPEAFFAALEHLAARDVPFRVAVCGQRYRQWPACFDAARTRLGDRVEQFGFVESRAAYLDLLARSDVVVSTANHEFFGVSVLEATHLGARPLVPDRLVYPEHFPAQFRYRDDADLADRLEAMCRGFVQGEPLRADRRALTRPLLAANVVPRYAAVFEQLTRGSS